MTVAITKMAKQQSSGGTDDWELIPTVNGLTGCNVVDIHTIGLAEWSKSKTSGMVLESRPLASGLNSS